MSELRLVPAALAVWAASIACVLAGTHAAVVVVAAFCAGSALLREWGQALLTAGLGAASVLAAHVRLRIADAWDYASPLIGTVSGQPKFTASGSWLTRIALPGHPSTLTVFSATLDDAIVPGATVAATGALDDNKIAGVTPVVLNGKVELVAPATGYAAFAQHVRETFRAAATARVGDASRGLIPGMVLGDTSLQTPVEQQTYIDTGLSHLSAVSGSNVAIVTTAAVVVATLLGLGLRVRLLAAAVALVAFAGMVGPEPSVLRASVTGLVGLVAVLASTRTEPLHALCLAVIGLVLVDTDLAVHYGFALSVAATAGIVVLHPLLYRALAATGWPDIINRALAVAIAADVVTMPIVALMAGQVSLVAVAANVLVAPAVAPVTVLGLIAVILALLPGGLEALPLFIIEPLAWWVHAVAKTGAALPLATVAAGPVAALVAYGWVMAGIVGKRPRATAAAVTAVLCATQLHAAPPTPDYSGMRAHVVATKADVDPIPPGTELVVVLEEGKPLKRPVVTQSGIPVLFPNRAGP